MLTQKTIRTVLCFLCCLQLAGCADNPPKDLNNICNIYHEKPDWFNASLHAQKKWGVPLQIPMAFMYQESHFQYNALPPKNYVLGFIPWGRISSAYGFAQAEDGAWKNYIHQTGNNGAKRTNFDDDVDFISWYVDQIHHTLGISRWDAYDLYLAYHEGMAGYKARTYQHKKWLKKVARKVQYQAQNYAWQYHSCKQQLLNSRGFFAKLFDL